jgi:hypothetical protein
VEGIPVSNGFLTILELQAMRADQLAGEAASDRQKGRTSIAWLKERIAQHYTTAKDTETDKRKVTILPPNPKKSFLDRAPNRLAPRFEQGTGSRHHILKGLGKIATKRYRILSLLRLLAI